MNKQIICIRWGSKYGADYINRLYGMVARNITPPFRFVCFTDDPSMIRPEVESLPLPDLGCELPKTRQGIWGKSRLWQSNLGDLSGPVLFMDLDLVITGNLDGFFEFGHPDDVVLTRNANTPFERLGQTSLYRFPIGKLTPLRDEFLSDPQGVAEKFVFEQRFVTHRSPGGVKFWPKGWVSTFRWHCMRAFPINYLKPPKLPLGTKAVIFPGGLNPPDAIAGRRNQRSICRTPLEHVIAGLRGERDMSLIRHLRSFLLPTKWVEDHWRE